MPGAIITPDECIMGSSLLSSAASLDALCQEIAARHPGADAERIRHDVSALLADLGREGLVHAVAGEHETPPPTV